MSTECNIMYMTVSMFSLFENLSIHYFREEWKLFLWSWWPEQKKNPVKQFVCANFSRRFSLKCEWYALSIYPSQIFGSNVFVAYMLVYIYCRGISFRRLLFSFSSSCLFLFLAFPKIDRVSTDIGCFFTLYCYSDTYTPLTLACLEKAYFQEDGRSRSH